MVMNTRRCEQCGIHLISLYNNKAAKTDHHVTNLISRHDWYFCMFHLNYLIIILFPNNSGNQFLQTREGKIIKGGAYAGHMMPNQTSSEIKKKKVIDIANAFKVLMIYY